MAFNFGELLFGTPQQQIQVPNRTPEQLGGMSQLLQQGLKYSNPEALAQRARSQFQQQTVPSLAERFTSLGQGAGGSGRLSSPAFASQLGQAGAGLEEGLAGLQSQYGLQLLQHGLESPFNTYLQQRQPGFLEDYLKYVLGGGGLTGGIGQGGGQGGGGLMQLLAMLA
jgi:hypothetical protein